MSIEELAARTWRIPRILSVALMAAGAVVLVLSLRRGGVPLTIAGGTSLLAGGVWSLWSLKTKIACFQALLDEPRRVERLVPVVVRIQGAETHYPVVVVGDDGRAYRIGTWTRSVREALAPFVARFPQAECSEGGEAYAPDDGVVARLKGIGALMGSVAVGLMVAGVMVLPMTLASVKAAEDGAARRMRRERAERSALESVMRAQVSGSWSACAVGDDDDSLVRVILEGAHSKAWSTKREGWVGVGHPLTLEDPTDRDLDFEQTSFLSAFLRALTGSRLEWPTAAVQPTDSPQWIVVGSLRGESLALRVVELSTGEVRCEGLAPVAHVDSASEEDRAMAAAVMLPLCDQLPPGACGDDASGAARLTRSCYESSKAPKLRGAVNVEYTIDPSGRVVSVKSTGSTDARLDRCVRTVFQDLRFSPPPTGSLMAMKARLSFD